MQFHICINYIFEIFYVHIVFSTKADGKYLCSILSYVYEVFYQLHNFINSLTTVLSRYYSLYAILLSIEM